MKVLVNLAVTIVALPTFIANGNVDWPPALLAEAFSLHVNFARPPLPCLVLQMVRVPQSFGLVLASCRGLTSLPVLIEVLGRVGFGHDGDAVADYAFNSAWGFLDAGRVFGTNAELRAGLRAGGQSV